MIESTILLDIDCLLDTTLACAYLQNKDSVRQILLGNYKNRRNFAPPGFSNEEFLSYYRKRASSLDFVELFESASVTGILTIVDRLSAMDIQRLSAIGRPRATRLVINFAPYNPGKNFKEVILRAVSAKLKNYVEISSDNIDDASLTPELIKKRFTHVIKLDYPVWLEAQTKNFEKVHCPEVQLVVPALVFGRELTEEEIASIENEWVREDPLRDIVISAAPFIDIALEDPGYFCSMLATG